VAEQQYAGLIRGINVGGNRKLPMAALRSALQAAGYEGVATYIQSGNVVLRSGAGAGAVGRGVEQVIEESFGFTVRVLVRNHDELEAIAHANPYLKGQAKAETSKLHVVFLDGSPPASSIARLDPKRSPGDEFTVAGHEIYLFHPNGYGRSKLSLDWFERGLGVAGTARNWNTLLKLIELTAP
jgi:uncharacterized protein (DUF1697 family)